MAINTTSVLQHELEAIDTTFAPIPVEVFTDIGYVQSVADGIAYVSGLTNIFCGGLVCFNNNILGLAVNIEENLVGITIIGNDHEVCQGDYVESLDQLLNINVDLSVLGCLLDALGNELLSLDDNVYSNTDDIDDEQLVSEFRPVEIKAPGIIARISVNEPLLTGLLAIDSMIPIGRGQRELIIGDRQTGKTAIAVDTIINQYVNDEVEIAE